MFPWIHNMRNFFGLIWHIYGLILVCIELLPHLVSHYSAHSPLFIETFVNEILALICKVFFRSNDWSHPCRMSNETRFPEVGWSLEESDQNLQIFSNNSCLASTATTASTATSTAALPHGFFHAWHYSRKFTSLFAAHSLDTACVGNGEFNDRYFTSNLEKWLLSNVAIITFNGKTFR